MNMVSRYKLVEKRNLWIFFSSIPIILAIALIGFRVFNAQPAMNYGVDFAGGSSMLLKFDAVHPRASRGSDADLQFIGDIREALKTVGLEQSGIQTTADGQVIIKTLEISNEKRSQVLTLLEQKFGHLELLESDIIGPTIGAELRQKSIWILGVAIIGLLIYISWRFDFNYGVAAIVALFHDALIAVSFAAIFHLEINAAFIGAILTILGYSLNDTVVIFDRIRENLKLDSAKEHSLTTIANVSVEQTFARSLYTVATVLITIVALLIFGGATIKEFCWVLLIGISAGAYSSIFIASPALVLMFPDFHRKATATNE